MSRASSVDGTLLDNHLSEIRDRLERLKTGAGLAIHKLEGDLRDDYRTLVRYIQLTRGTDNYKRLHDEIVRIFEGVSPIVPGTVGAYFAGCLSSLDYPGMQPGCSAICAGSAPLPSGPNCKYVVILASTNPKTDSFEFQVLNRPGDNGASTEPSAPSEAIVYLDSADRFTGFTDEEKATLKSLAGGNVRILRYSADSKSYVDVTNGMNLQELPSRANIISAAAPQETSNKTLWIILFLILVALAIFIGWQIVSKNKTL